MRFDGKSVLITGATSGIGAATARAFAALGADLLLTGRDEARGAAVLGSVSDAAGKAAFVAADVRDPDQIGVVVQKAVDVSGRIDVLVNNAGFSPAAALEQLPMQELLRTFEVNFFAGLQLIGEVTPIMREQGGGRIINMSSLAGSIPAPMAVAYASTKGALESATDCLRLELAPWKIRLSLVIPGFVDTDTFDNSRKAAEDLRNDPANPYRQLMFDLDDFATKNLKNAIQPSVVGAVVVKAATARRPRTRYYVPFSANLQSRFLGYLPDSVLDWLLLKLYKVPVARN